MSNVKRKAPVKCIDHALVMSKRLKSDRIDKVCRVFCHYNVDITLTKDVGISNVVPSCTAGTGTREMTIRDEVLTLTTTSTTLCSGYILPATTLFDKLSLVIEYDIYDKRGNKISERTAENALTNPLKDLQRGEERTLQINIDPSYLYDLSLNDPPIDIKIKD